MFSEALFEDLYRDFTKEDPTEEIECGKDEVLLRNLISCQKVAAKKIHLMTRHPIDLPCKSVRNAPLYIPQLVKLFKK